MDKIVEKSSAAHHPRYFQLNAAKYWLNCAGWPVMQARHPELRMKPKVDKNGRIPKARVQGLALHDLSSTYIKARVRPPADLVGKVHVFEERGEEVRHLLTPKDVVQLQNLWDWVCEGDPLILLSELRAPVPPVFEETDPDFQGWHGYLDVVIEENDYIRLVEMKFGATPVVLEHQGDDADRFPLDEQSFLELAAAVESAPNSQKYTTFQISVYQPNAQNHPDWQTVTFDRARYNELLQAVRNRYEAARVKSAKPKAGSWCAYCPMQSVCLVHTDVAFEGIQARPDLPDELEKALLEDLDLIPIDRILKSYKHLPLLRSYMSQVEKLVTQYAKEGGKVPGRKLVQKRTQRSWLDKNQATQWAVNAGIPLDAACPREPLSPTQMEALANARGISGAQLLQLVELMKRGEGDLHLVPDIAPTPAYTPPSLDGVFQNLTQQKGESK